MEDRKVKVKRWQAHHDRSMERFREWVDTGYDYRFRPVSEPYPDDLRGLACGAKTRAGTPCKRTDIYHSGRCKYHGGKSTGAKTVEGKARQLEGFYRWLEAKRSERENVSQE
jgi:hypothetical protein